MKDPLLQTSIDEIQEMSHDEFRQLVEQSNEYVRKKYDMLNNSNYVLPHFSSEEELMSYYHAIPLEDAEKRIAENCGHIIRD